MPGIAIPEAPSALGHVPERRGVEKAPAIGMAGGSGLAVGSQITVYDPDFDPR